MKLNKYKVYIFLRIVYFALYGVIYLFGRMLLKANQILDPVLHIFLIFIILFPFVIGELFHNSKERRRTRKTYKKEYIKSKSEFFKFIINFLFPHKIKMNVSLKFLLMIAILFIWRTIRTRIAPENNPITLVVTIIIVAILTIWSIKLVIQHSPLVDKKKK